MAVLILLAALVVPGLVTWYLCESEAHLWPAVVVTLGFIAASVKTLLSAEGNEGDLVLAGLLGLYLFPAAAISSWIGGRMGFRRARRRD